jgi:hypothetical protein
MVLGPIAVYVAFRVTLEIPEVVAELPTAGRRAIEALGVLFVVGALLLVQDAPFNRAMAFIGLVLLVTPLAAHKLSQFKAGTAKA